MAFNGERAVTFSIEGTNHCLYSDKLYKQKFKQWGWSKYLTAEKANWMSRKKEKRMREDQKETSFQVGGRDLSVDEIQRKAKRAKPQDYRILDGQSIADCTQGSTDKCQAMPTPTDVRYSTPVNTSSHGVGARYSSGSRSNRWTPTPILNALQRKPRRMIWSGLTCLDILTIHERGHSLDEDGEWDEAEENFREALAGCQVLLSPAHEHTRIFTYHLADFYAQHDRMADADKLLDWMTDRILNRFEATETLVVAHLLKIAELLRKWRRLDEAKAFGIVLAQLVSSTHVQWGGSATEASTMIPRVNMPPSLVIGAASTQGLGNLVMPLSTEGMTDESRAHDRKLMDSKLSLAMAYVEANDARVEEFLEHVIRQCEDRPKNLMAHILKAWTTMAQLYQNLRRLEKMDRALLRIREILMNISKDDYGRMKSLPLVAIESAKLYIELGRNNAAAEIFSRIECGIVDAVGPDLVIPQKLASDLLIKIGVWFQDQNRWKDARPRFERALCLALAAHDFKCELIKRLETTLEDRRYVHPAKRPCECFDLSDESYGACTIWTTATSTGKVFVAKQCHLALEDL